MSAQTIRCPVCQEPVKVSEGEMIPCPKCGYYLTQESVRDVGLAHKIRIPRKKLLILCGIGGAIFLALLFLLVFSFFLRSDGGKEPREKQLQAARLEVDTEENHTEKSEESDPEEESFVSGQIELDQVLGIKVENEFGGFHYYKSEDGRFYFEGAEEYFYDDITDWMTGEEQDLTNLIESFSMVDSLVYLSRYLHSAVEVVNYDKNNLQLYGLDNGGKASLTLTYLNDKGETESQTVLFGNPTVSGSAYYVMLEGKEGLYTMQDVYISRCVFTDLKAYLSPRVAPSVSSEESMKLKELIVKKGGELFVALRALNEEEQAKAGDLFTHVLIHPEGYYADAESLETLTETFVNFAGERVVEYRISERSERMQHVFREYRLVDSENRWIYELSYSYSDFDAELYISEKTLSEDGAKSVYYVYSPSFDVIVEFDAGKLSWVEWDKMKFVEPHLVNEYIDTVSTIEIFSSDVNATFTLQGAGEELKITSSNGVAIDTDNFRQFYKAILYARRGEAAEKPDEAESILRVRVCLRSGEEIDLEFFAQTARKAYYTLNGEGGFSVNREYIGQIITACESLLKGETVVTEPKN